MAASEMWDFLTYATPDYNAVLDVTPSVAIPEIVTGQDKIIRMYDTSEERLSFSDYPDMNIVLKWDVLRDAEAGTVFDWFCNPAKGARTTRSFLWDHPTDGHQYVVRFDESMTRIRQMADLVDIAEIRLRVIGRGPWGATLDLNPWTYRNNATGAPSTVTVVRASAATYIDADGVLQSVGSNILRHDWDPATGEYLGWLIEGSRTNLCLQSENLATTWINFASDDSVNTLAAPDGAVTADTLIEDATAAVPHGILQNITVTANTVYCVSVFLKAKERSHALIRWVDASGGAADGYIQTGLIDLTAGTIDVATADNGGAVTGSGIQDIGNGWYRAWISGKFNATDTDGRVIIYLHNGTSGIYAGDGTSGLYVWGAQVEAGASPTSYIPTTTAAVIRAADQPSIVGTDFSRWYTQGVGTLFIHYRLGETLINTRAVWISEDASNFFTVISGTAGGDGGGAYFRVGGVDQAVLPALQANSAFDVVKLAAAWAANDAAASRDGGVVATDASAVTEAAASLYIGWDGTSRYINGHIRRIMYWDKRLTNADLIAFSGGDI